MPARIENRAAIDEFVGSLTRNHNAHELTAKLQAAGVAAYPVENCVDIHQDDNLEAFGFWHWLEHKEMGPSPYEGLEHRMSRTPGTLRSAAPILGQDNDEVFRGCSKLERDGDRATKERERDILSPAARIARQSATRAAAFTCDTNSKLRSAICAPAAKTPSSRSRRSSPPSA